MGLESLCFEYMVNIIAQFGAGKMKQHGFARVQVWNVAVKKNDNGTMAVCSLSVKWLFMCITCLYWIDTPMHLCFVHFISK